MLWASPLEIMLLAVTEPSSLHIHCQTTTILSRSEAKNVLNNYVLPESQYGSRIALGTKAQNLNDERGVLTSNDPVLFETYGEFPLESLDVLLDRAETFLPTNDERTVVDLGSGCGRLALYMALSRRPLWNVHGIEISPTFHREATEAVDRGAEGGWLEVLRRSKESSGLLSLPETPTDGDSNLLSLHLGPAAEYARLLQKSDIIFCYSTAFESSGFSEQVSALLLGHGWNELLTKNCHENAICITTDKALNPAYGWSIVDRIDVSNPEVFESTGYIQRLERRFQ